MSDGINIPYGIRNYHVVEFEAWYEVATEMNHMRTPFARYTLSGSELMDAMKHIVGGRGLDLEDLASAQFEDLLFQAMSSYGNREPRWKFEPIARS